MLVKTIAQNSDIIFFWKASRRPNFRTTLAVLVPSIQDTECIFGISLLRETQDDKGDKELVVIVTLFQELSTHVTEFCTVQ